MTIKGIILIMALGAGAYVSTTYVQEEKAEVQTKTQRDTLQGHWKPVGYTASRFDSLEFRENFIILKSRNRKDPDVRRYILNEQDRILTIDELLGEDSIMGYNLNGNSLELRAPGIGRTLEWKRR